VSLGGATAAQAQLSTSCQTTLNSASTNFVPGFNTSFSLKAGEVVSYTILTGGPLTWTSPAAVTTAVGQTATFTVATTGTVLFSSTATGTAGTFRITCGLATQGGGSPAISQNVANAQVAVTNGQQTLRSMSDWISKAILGSFTPHTPATAAADRPAPLTARAALERLRSEERTLAAERAELPSEAGAAVLDRQLADVRREVAFARLAVDLASPTSQHHWRERSTLTALDEDARAYSLKPQIGVAQDDIRSQQGSAIDNSPTGDRISAPPAAPAVSLSSRDLADSCGGPDQCDVIDSKWNIWLEGRVIGATDSVAQSAALGFVGSAGGDYKLLPWLATGLAVGFEGFENRFGTQGLRIGSTGFTAAPYVGVRLDEHITASVFAGLTGLTYNSTPATAVTANFQALRLFVGGALTGVWRDGPWRFQPTLGGTYASEQQNGYSDSSGTVVSPMTVTYGRVSAGPEIGYTFQGPQDRWTVEPFVMATANIDFTSSNLTALNGQAVTLRPGTQGSGSAGLGFNLRFPDGFSLRAQGSYESIGVVGLDVWQGVLRGSLAF
jgi:Autotransporter beta-domain